MSINNNFTNSEMLSRFKTVWSQDQYKNLMVNFLPHFENPQRFTLPAHKKRKNKWGKTSSTTAMFSTIFNSMVYSYVGSKIDRGEEVDLCTTLVDSILKENMGDKDYYNKTALQHGIALLQLLQDEEKRRKDDPRAVGSWAMELLGKSDGGIPIEKLRSASLMFVSSLFNKACDSNVSFTIEVTSLILDEEEKTELSVSEVGVLVLFALIPLKILKQVNESTFFSNSGGFAQYTFSKLFVPVCRTHHNAVWKETKEFFCLEPRIFEGSKFLSSSKNNNFILIQIDDEEMLKGWIISNMLSILYKQRCYRTVTHHRDMQLVIEEKTRKVCIKLWDAITVRDLEELEDAVYVEESGEPCYEFITFHFAVYLRMLLLINPKYRIRLEEDWSNSQFLFTSKNVGPHCQLYFYAYTPTNEEERREMSANEISNFISKFIIKNGWYYHRSQGYQKEGLEPLFNIGQFLENQMEIRAGAVFIAKTLDVEYNDKDKELKDKELKDFSVTPEKAMKSFDVLFKEIQIEQQQQL